MADYVIKKLEEAPDVLGDYPGEMRMMTYELDAEKVAFTWRRMPSEDGRQGLLWPPSQGGGGDLLRRRGQAPVQARGRRPRPRGRHRRPGAAARPALGLERRARGRGADHRVPARLGSPGRRRDGRRLLAGRVELGAMAPAAALGDSFRSFFDAVDSFFSSVGAVHLGSAAARAAGVHRLPHAARAGLVQHLRAAYPDTPVRFLLIWGAYFAGYGFNSVIPARGGDVIRLFLTKTSVPAPPTRRSPPRSRSS